MSERVLADLLRFLLKHERTRDIMALFLFQHPEARKIERALVRAIVRALPPRPEGNK